MPRPPMRAYVASPRAPPVVRCCFADLPEPVPWASAVPGRRTRPTFGQRRCAAARAVLLSPWREAFSLKNASRLRTLMLLPEQFLHLQNILTHNLADFRPFHHAPPFGTGISSVRTASPGSSDTSATTSEP